MYTPAGIYPAMPTPFKKDESLDLEALKTLIGYYMEAGVHGVMLLGSVGESAMLSEEEKREVIDAAVDMAKSRTAVVVGTGAPSTRQTVETTRYAKDAGATVAIIVAPYFFHPTPIGLKDHFITVANEVDFPILVYNVPGFAVNRLTPDMVHRFAQVENIVGIKDSSGNLFDVMELIRLAPKRFSVLCGWDTILLSALMAGAKGGMIGSAAIAPKLLLDLYNAVLNKDVEKALTIQRQVNFIFRGMFVGAFPAAIKAALNIMGLPGGYVRSPIENLKATEQATIRFELERAGVLQELK